MNLNFQPRAVLAWGALATSILCLAIHTPARAQVNVPAAQAITTNLPAVQGDGVFLEIYTNYAGGSVPTAADFAGLPVAAFTPCPIVNFNRPSTETGPLNVDKFLDDATVLPGRFRGLATSNLAVRAATLLRITRELDRDPATATVEVDLAVHGLGGFRLTIGTTEITNRFLTAAATTTVPVSFADVGLYPLELLYQTPAQRSASLYLRWRPKGAATPFTIPAEALYLQVPATELAVTFDDLSVNKQLDDEYVKWGLQFQTLSGNLRVFSSRGQSVVPVNPNFVYGDPAASPAAPGELELKFVEPGTTIPATTDWVEFFLINAASGAVVRAYNLSNALVDERIVQTDVAERQRIVLSNAPVHRVALSLGEGTNAAALDNLRFAAPTAAPDLKITALELPSQVAAGSYVPVVWTFRNQGSRPAYPPFSAYLYLSKDDLEGNDDRLYFRQLFAPLAAG